MRTKRGSITIETAITFTIFLVFIAGIISAAQFYKTNILMQRAVEQSCEKVSVLTPLSISSGSAISTVSNALPDVEIEGAENVTRVMSYVVGIDKSTGNPLAELLLENMFAPYMANDISKRYKELNDSDFFAPKYIDVSYNINTAHSCIEVTVTYKVTTIVGKFERKVYSIIPIYGDPQFLLFESKKKSDSDIWSADNFTRGNYFRDDNGANLPEKFPVIDAYNDGTITSIRSIDLTAPQYQSQSKTEKVVMEELIKLKNFEGATYSSGGETVKIPESSIDKRKLVIIIPSNATDEQKKHINSIKKTALAEGISMEIREQGVSNKYK